MEVSILAAAKRNSDGTYEILVGSYDESISYRIYSVILEERHSGRPWLLCNDLYGTTDNVELLMTVNGIVNPLTIEEGTVLFYPDKDDVQHLESSQSAQSVAAALDAFARNANLGKEQKRDQNRAADKSKERKTESQKNNVTPRMTPNMAKTQDSGLQFGDGNIILLPNF